VTLKQPDASLFSTAIVVEPGVGRTSTTLDGSDRNEAVKNCCKLGVIQLSEIVDIECRPSTSVTERRRDDG
jgi:hypothetical protein